MLQTIDIQPPLTLLEEYQQLLPRHLSSVLNSLCRRQWVGTGIVINKTPEEKKIMCVNFGDFKGHS